MVEVSQRGVAGECRRVALERLVDGQQPRQQLAVAVARDLAAEEGLHEGGALGADVRVLRAVAELQGERGRVHVDVLSCFAGWGTGGCHRLRSSYSRAVLTRHMNTVQATASRTTTHRAQGGAGTIPAASRADESQAMPTATALIRSGKARVSA